MLKVWSTEKVKDTKSKGRSSGRISLSLPKNGMYFIQEFRRIFLYKCTYSFVCNIVRDENVSQQCFMTNNIFFCSFLIPTVRDLRCQWKCLYLMSGLMSPCTQWNSAMIQHSTSKLSEQTHQQSCKAVFRYCASLQTHQQSCKAVFRYCASLQTLQQSCKAVLRILEMTWSLSNHGLIHPESSSSN